MTSTQFSGFDPTEPLRSWRMSPAPLLPVAAGMVGGIALDRVVHLPPAYAIAALVLAGGALVAVRRPRLVRPVAVTLAAVALGSVLHDNAFRRIPHNHIMRYTADEPVVAKVTGTLLADPVVRDRPGGHFARWIRGRVRTRLLIEAEQIAGPNGPIDLTGLVQVHVKEPVLNLSAGNRIRLIGRLYRPPPPSNPGQFDWSALLRRRGILVGMSCKYAAGVSRLIDNGAQTHAGFRQRLRTRVRRWLHHHVTVPEGAASLLDAMVLGQRGAVTRAIDEAFIRTGTAHCLAVSGMHVGMLALFVWWLAGLTGSSRPVRAVVVLTVVVGYVLVAEHRVPVIRAGIMCGLGCIAAGLKRRTSSLNWLAAGAIVILVWRPCDLFSPGFQLSFGIVLGILLLTPMLAAGFRWIRGWMRRVPAELDDPRSQWPLWRRWVEAVRSWLALLTVVSITAWLMGSAIAVYHFQRFSPWGWLNSLLIWPLAMLMVMSGFVKVLLSAVWPQTAAVIGPMLGWGSTMLAAGIQCLAKLPWTSIDCRQPPWWGVVLYLGGLLAIAICWRFGVRKRWLIALGLVPLMAAAASLVGPLERDDELKMWLLSVGDGQVALLKMPGQGHWISDAGTMSGFDVGEAIAVPAFRHLGVRRIRRAIVSHANFDHYAGLLAIDDHFPVEQVVMSPHFAGHAHPGGAARFLLDQIARREIPIRTASVGDRVDVDGPAGVEVLWPPESLPGTWSANDCSLVIRVRYAGRSILICGDIGAEPQRRLMDRGDLRSDVLVLPHHGAVKASTADFIAAVDPQVVIRSGGRRRGASRPTIERVVGGRLYFDTARDGAVEVKIRRDGLDARAPFGQEANTRSTGR